MNLKKYLIISVALITSYFCALLLNKSVFIANTPKIRPEIALNFKKDLIALIKKPVVEPAEKLKNIPFVMLNKGVYAKSDGSMSYTLIKDNEVEWIVYKFKIKGKQITIKVPKGQTPPPMDMLEKLE